jgi:ferredoxin--NADP+ reductase
MFTVIDKKELAPHVFAIEILAPEISQKVKPGQFVMLKIDKEGERIPLTVAETEPQKKTIVIIFQDVGKTTHRLAQMKKHSTILDLLGPLGKQTEIKYYGTVLLVGGGVGIAELYPLVKALKECDNKIYTVLGARTKSLVILEEELKEFSDALYITTDDGTYGEKGVVTEVLDRLLKQGVKIDLAYAIGPTVMMKRVAELTKRHEIKTIVNLNPIMVDGTGMCGSCRVTVAGKVKFACVDGPEFDAQEVNFDELVSRQKLFLEQERARMDADSNADKCG